MKILNLKTDPRKQTKSFLTNFKILNLNKSFAFLLRKLTAKKISNFSHILAPFILTYLTVCVCFCFAILLDKLFLSRERLQRFFHIVVEKFQFYKLNSHFTSVAIKITIKSHYKLNIIWWNHKIIEWQQWNMRIWDK